MLALAPLLMAPESPRALKQVGSGEDGKPVSFQVLSIGVADFQHLDGPEQGDLHYTEADAKAVAEAFVRGTSGAIHCTDPADIETCDGVTLILGQDATHDAMRDAVEAALYDADRDDVVVLFIATHGQRLGRGGVLYGWDTNPERLESTGFQIRDLEDAIAASPAKHILLFTDACHSGLIGSGGSRTGVDTAVNGLLGGMSYVNQSLYILSSSGAAQVSVEAADYCGGHGAFTCGLLQALDGHADRNNDGLIDVAELSLTVSALVHAMTEEGQLPEYKGDYDSKLAVAQVPETYSAPGVLSLSSPAGGEVFVDGKRRLSLGAFQEAELRLTPGLHEVCVAEDCTKLLIEPSQRVEARLNNPETTGLSKLPEYPMARVEPGQLEMGSAESDARRHDVTLSHTIEVGQTEVTQRLYEAVMGHNPSTPSYQNLRQADSPKIQLLGPNLPVQGVTWMDAVAFANAYSDLSGLERCYLVTKDSVLWPNGLDCTGYRLPTEAEWEYAARAGASGAQLSSARVGEVPLCELANVADQSYAATGASLGLAPCDDGFVGASPVASFPANAWGLHDMTGNVSEWVWDLYAPYTRASATDPSGPREGRYRVTRGGDWASDIASCDYAARGQAEPQGGRSKARGFRLVRTMPGA